MSWIKILEIQDLEVLRARKVTIGQCEMGIFRLLDGSLRAIGNFCPHRQGYLAEGLISGHYVYCPLHDWKIDLDSGLAQTPDEGETQIFPIKVEGNAVYVAIDDMARTMCLNHAQSQERLSIKD